MPIQFSDRYQNTFSRLLESVGSRKRPAKGEMTALWPMCGHRYDGRLLIVGRAPNGWEGRFTAQALQDSHKRTEILKFAREVAEDGVLEWRRPGRCPMLWVSDQWDDPRGGGYNTSKSRFWLVAREVARALALPGSTSRDWPSALCWSDLYKIAAKDTGNPTTSLMRAQFSVATELLAQEVRELSPKLVLVLAGFDWYSPFVDALGLEQKKLHGPSVEAISQDGETRWLFVTAPTYMRPGISVESYRRDILKNL
jgi:hypothetical protein